MKDSKDWERPSGLLWGQVFQEKLKDGSSKTLPGLNFKL